MSKWAQASLALGYAMLLVNCLMPEERVLTLLYAIGLSLSHLCSFMLAGVSLLCSFFPHTPSSHRRGRSLSSQTLQDRRVLRRVCSLVYIRLSLVHTNNYRPLGTAKTEKTSKKSRYVMECVEIRTVPRVTRRLVHPSLRICVLMPPI